MVDSLLGIGYIPQTMNGPYALPTVRCIRCQHAWHPRKPERPVVCPRCKDPHYDRPYIMKPRKRRRRARSVA